MLCSSFDVMATVISRSPLLRLFKVAVSFTSSFPLMFLKRISQIHHHIDTAIIYVKCAFYIINNNHFQFKKSITNFDRSTIGWHCQLCDQLSFT